MSRSCWRWRSSLAGASVALISALTYQHAVYPNTDGFSDALLKDLGVTREQALAYIRVHPEVVFDARRAPGGTETQKLVNEAFQQVQRQVQEDAVNRARLWTIVFIGVLSIVDGRHRLDGRRAACCDRCG